MKRLFMISPRLCCAMGVVLFGVAWVSNHSLVSVANAQAGAAAVNLTDMSAEAVPRDTTPADVGTRAGQIVTGGVVTYTDRSVFTAAFPDLTFEDFEDSACAALTGFPAPLDATSNNACFTPGQIPAGISFADNPLNDSDGVGSPSGLVFVPVGSGGAINDFVGANSFIDSFEIFLTPTVDAVGLDLGSFSTASTLRIQVFGPTSGDLLNDTTYPSVGPAGAFFGIDSGGVGIARINLFANNGAAGNGAEGVYGVLFGNTTGVAGTFPPDENFDENAAPLLPSDWPTAFSGGGVAWNTDTAFANTAPNAAHAPEFPSVSDMTLDSPSFTPVAGQTLSFQHKYVLESGFDGAVLEISTDGGATFQDIIAAGGSFTSGGYDAIISSAFLSPIAGRMAWTGDSGGFVTTEVALPAAAVGQPTVLRFRTADDSSVAPPAPNGWWVDTIHLGVDAGPPVIDVSPASLSASQPTDSLTNQTLTIGNTGGSDLNWSITEAIPAAQVPAATAKAASSMVHPTSYGAGPAPDTSSGYLGIRAASPAGGDVLYDQYDNDSGTGIVSQDFETANDGFDNQGADDFVVPGGETWSVTQVDVAGAYFNGFGPADSFNVYFYADAGGLPGALVTSQLGLAYSNAAAAVIPLTTPVMLTAGTYWVSVQARMDLTVGGEWGWETRTVQANSPAAWQNPNDGFATGCTTWGDMQTCVGFGPDLVFRLHGTNGPPSACSSPSDIPWVSVAPANGTTAAGGSSDVTVTFDSTGLAPDTYEGVLCVTSNDPATPVVEVPVSLEVTTAPPACDGGADEIFCDGFDGVGPAPVAALSTDRADFLADLSPGYFGNPLRADVTSYFNPVQMSTRMTN